MSSICVCPLQRIHLHKHSIESTVVYSISGHRLWNTHVGSRVSPLSTDQPCPIVYQASEPSPSATVVIVPSAPEGNRRRSLKFEVRDSVGSVSSVAEMQLSVVSSRLSVGWALSAAPRLCARESSFPPKGFAGHSGANVGCQDDGSFGTIVAIRPGRVRQEHVAARAG